MVLEVLKEKGEPLRGVCAHAEIDHSVVDLGVDFDLIALWLVGDRLAWSPSAIFRNFIFGRPHMDNLIGSSKPFRLFDPTINLGRLSLARDKVRIELEIG